MKLDYCIIALGFITLLLLVMVGINNPVASFNRPLFAICMNLMPVFYIIGYVSMQKEIEKRYEKRKLLIKYLEQYKKEYRDLLKKEK